MILGIAGLRRPQHPDARLIAPGRLGRGRPGQGSRSAEHPGDQAVEPRPGRLVERRRGGQRRHRCGFAERPQPALQVVVLHLGQRRWRQSRQAECGDRQRRRTGHLGPGQVQLGCGCFGDRGQFRQRHRGDLELGLERDRVDRVVGNGVHGQVGPEQVVPVERREQVARQHPVGDQRGQDGPAAPRADLDPVAVDDFEPPRVGRVQLDERARVQLVQGGDLRGLGEGVPLVLQASGVEHEAELVVGQFGRLDMRPGVEHGPSAGRREGQPWHAAVRSFEQPLADPVVEVAQRVAAVIVGLGLDRGCRPLHGRAGQPLVAHPAQVVAGGRVVKALDLLEHVLTAGVVEGVGVTHRPGHLGDDLPVGKGLADGVDRLLQQGQIAFGVDRHVAGFGPQRGGQQHVGVRVGLGVGERVLAYHQLAALQPGRHRGPVGDRGDRVGADHPAGLHRPFGHPAEQIHGAGAGLAAQGAGGQVPDRLGERPIGRVEHAALPGQARPHVAHLATAHRVGLPGERERPAARTADGACGQVQVDQRVGVPGAVGALVEAHRPARHPASGASDQIGRATQVGLVQSGQPGHHIGRVVGQERRHGLPALGVLEDERPVDVAGLHQQVQQPVQQGQVGAGPKLQEQVGGLGGGGAPRVDHDQFRPGAHPVHHPQVQDRVAVGHVRPDHQEHVRVIEVGVRPGRGVRAEGQLVTGAGAGHAEPRVRLDLVGADEALGQLVRQVLRLQRHLPRHVQRHGVGTVGVDQLPQPAAHLGDRLAGGAGLWRGAAGGADHRGLQPSGRGEHGRAGGPLGAQPAPIRRVLLVAGDLGDPAASGLVGLDLQQHAAADAAVGTGGFHLGRGGHRAGPPGG